MPGSRVLLMTGDAAQAATDASFLGHEMALIVEPFDPEALLRKVGRR